MAASPWAGAWWTAAAWSATQARSWRATTSRSNSGTLTIEGRPARGASPRDAVRLGFALCPEDRKTDGIVGELSVRGNIAPALQARRGRLRHMQSREQIALAERFVKALDIRTADIEKPVKFLSATSRRSCWRAG